MEVAAPRLRAQRKRWGEGVVKGALAFCALVSIATTVGIVAALLEPSIEFFREISIVDFLTGTEWTPLFSPAQFGVLPLVAGTLAVTFWAVVVAVPFGLGAAIFLSEYARPGVRKALKPALELLAGVPTVVYGYFALVTFTPFLRSLGLEVAIFNVFSAGVVMGVMIIPTVASISEDAMSAVPQSLRDGAYALGSNKLEVSLRIVVPAAISGIVASFVLGISRAVGETMIVVLAAGNTPNLTFSPVESVQAMTAYIATTATGEIAQGTVEYDTIFAVGTVLFLMTLVMNVISIRLVRRFREVYE